ncbi:hypothetical protein KEJ39_03975 [Candidatus Bathyarchaeota archaeon]|nr:hypothetical protein [Candidatus Bathyarchaeota archaeon]
MNRLLAKMIKEGYVKMGEDGAVSLKRGRLTVGEYPGSWIALGPGASLVFLGLGYVENDSLLILCSLSFLLYTVAVVLHSLTRLSPF